MAEKIDVLIIGAGPAGSIAAAMIHKEGLSVRVVEREKFPRFVIGESLLPRCMEVLEDAELLEAVKAKNFQQKFGAKFVKGDDVADYNFSEQFTKGWTWTWQVPRAEFDLALTDEIQRKGVKIDFETTVTGIELDDAGNSETTVQRKDNSTEKISARFIIDASGYGRVIPKLFNLEKPSNLDPRKAIFAHVNEPNRELVNEPNRITIVTYAPGIWVWIIPFSNGITSLGFVGSFDFFNTIEGDIQQQFHTLIAGNEYLKKRFQNVSLVFEPRKLEAWSATTEKFYGNGFVLTGNVTEFLDPVFSSGVMFATVSAHMASKLVIKKLKSEEVDWDQEYSKPIQQGVDTFRTYVLAWYDGSLEKIFFASDRDKVIKEKICSVLAGYVWDEENLYVKEHATAIPALVRTIRMRDAFAKIK
ncbi:MAG TPA: NAD(P)/FAD-dependent oxidoreductase [Chryseolinea sp.]|nr:NAD(P)/FAD-dependent oxidoreductase [Chryseolinea sp.]HPH45742.1 NAD(P)/FAD-dependent oxidoreductase [Chryseolinea sp.]HPM30275.1 NAD(P)/FAD-dependent oxidoreductase [Chryseolinea sp.]